MVVMPLATAYIVQIFHKDSAESDIEIDVEVRLCSTMQSISKLLNKQALL